MSREPGPPVWVVAVDVAVPWEVPNLHHFTGEHRMRLASQPSGVVAADGDDRMFGGKHRQAASSGYDRARKQRRTQTGTEARVA